MLVEKSPGFKGLVSHNALANNENLKILIVSTPKTGNTWLRYLVSAIYNLPMVEIDRYKYDSMDMSKLGQRWVSQEHLYPTNKLLNWANQNQITLLTTIRHPGDVFVSFYHYLQNFSREFHQAETTDFYTAFKGEVDNKEKEFLRAVSQYISKDFFMDLNVSVSWIRSKQSHVVRYEDLWRNPKATLTELTSKMYPVDEDTIERAIDRCEIDQLRKSVKLEGNEKFFRVGGIGGWRKALPPEVITLFEKIEPYPAQFKVMGYTLDPNDPLIVDPIVPRVSKNPFVNISQFDNGTLIAPIMVNLFLSISSEISQVWRPVEKTEPLNSYFNWLNASSEEPGSAAGTTLLPIISNLSAYIYSIRPDLQAAYPDLYGKNRAGYIIWFIKSSRLQYNIDQAFIDPLFDSLRNWSMKAISNEEENNFKGLALTNLAAYIYATRPDLPTVYPDITGKHRLAYFFWFLNQAPIDYNLGDNIFEPIRDKFLRWANDRYPEDISQNAGPILTNFMQYLFQTDRNIQKAFPDIFGKDRIDFAVWLLDNYRAKGLVENALLLPLVSSWAEK